MKKILLLLTVFSLSSVLLFAENSETKKQNTDNLYNKYASLPSKIDSILQESEKKQLNGAFIASKGLYKQLIFADKDKAVIDTGLDQTKTNYFIYGNIAVIKLDKGGFFELEILKDGSLKGLDSHTKGCIYTKKTDPEKKVSPFILDDAGRRILQGNLYFYSANSYAKKSRDIKKIFSLYDVGAKKGSSDCANKCGIILLNFNKKKAIMYFNYAAGLGSGNAYYNLAVIYKNDKKKYIELLRKAADLNCKEARIDLVMIGDE